ncbi:MAG: RnfABCDGE type electron transport complex subunit D [Patescibacteria group bacterium]|nr:RnfABCDGE type electron transport complex subunit D [Patescibacteria group bacterium]
MIHWIDEFLNQITMYRLVLYYLICLWLLALVFSLFGILPFTPVVMIISLVVILSVSWAVNNIFAWAFRAVPNVESIYITVMILALIITPSSGSNNYIFMGWAAVWAMASKYMMAVKKKHLFNPAAFAVVLTALTLGQGASWWIGTTIMMPFVTIGGMLIVRKIIRTDLALSFALTAAVTIIVGSLIKGTSLLVTVERIVLYSPWLFFTFIMITEPLTTPPSRKLRIMYGVLVGFLFSPQIHILGLYSTPELALLVGNVFVYFVSPKVKAMLTLKKVDQLTSDTAEFIFSSDSPVKFTPGQYLEWTVGHSWPDNRGNRRYFTLASSPTEAEVKVGIKFSRESSSYKRALLALNPGDQITVGQLAGDFVLPANGKEKLVFIAGGIGITPFKSMIQYLNDTGASRDAILIYANKTQDDIAYKNYFDQMGQKLNIKMVYTLTDKTVSTSWTGERGYINERLISAQVPDFKERIFYISGPHSMVIAARDSLRRLGVRSTKIVTDFFPGFA